MGKSSKDKRDAYYRLAKEQGWRARSAFKLLQLDEEFNLFEGVTRVVDLCAAPGSWSQVLSRVLIKGEKFGRAAWTDKQERLRNIAFGSQKEEEVKAQDTAAAGTTSETGTSFDDSTTSLDDSTTSPDGPRHDVKIVSIDLQPMSPLDGITCLRADITAPSTIPLLLSALDPDSYDPKFDAITASHPVDLILSDGAPDVTGLHDLDIYIQSQLLWAALNLALCVLKPGGKFVAKIFRGKDVDLLYAQLRIVFEKVTVAKPRSSRASSIEAFIVCEGFRVPEGFVPSMEEPVGAGRKIQGTKQEVEKRTEPYRQVREDGITELELGSEEDEEELEADVTPQKSKDVRWIAPFLACGDLDAYDADATYHLPSDHVSLDPVQPPTAPPYKKALEMRRAAGGAYGKTKKQIVAR